ncbi:acyl-CoA thioesterase [Legionella busanensis]|uniref:Acyl-CoA thioesterase n=1 Tax=Legionella busanensis TaxID=190655 RepID=A0A378JLQ6_9GAMM|nr:acyl-CoA thioesterase [Legionella busanensis]STX51020.1 acyl-CoA thioesterase [Legionella busanensis]
MFQIELQVRDYECDIQGIVNNAVYQHYFEHARHLFLDKKGINFFELTQQGIFLVIYRAEIDYLAPLTINKTCKVSVELERISKARCLFKQTIYINNDIYTKGKFFTTAVNANKKPINLDFLNLN